MNLYGFSNSRLVHLSLLVLLTITAYANTLDAPFYLDDILNIVYNPYIKDVSYFAAPLDLEIPYANPEFKYLPFQTRYMGYVSFMLNYKAHGLDVRGFHVVNISIHLLNGVLVYWLVRLLFMSPVLGRSSLAGHSGLLALFAALVFALHPLQTQAVTYIVQRFASMSALFYMASIAFFLKYRLTGRKPWYMVSLLSALFAMYTKESSITLPVIIVLLEISFFEGRAKERVMRLVPFALLLLVIPSTLLLVASQGEGLSSEIVQGMSLQPTTSRLEYLLTQFGVVTKYIRLLLLPYGQNIDYDLPVYGSFAEPEVFLPFIFLSSLLGGACYILYRSLRGQAGWDPLVRLAAFGVLWFFVTLSVESSIIPIADIIFEHRVYLPSVGFIVAVEAGLALLLVKGFAHRLDRVLVVLCMVAVLVYLPLTYKRNLLWGNGVSLWEDVVRKSPLKARPHANLCKQYVDRDELQAAIKECKTALSVQPDPMSFQSRPLGAFYSLGKAYKKLGMQDMAIKTYEGALALYPDRYWINNELGLLHGQAGRLNTALGYLRKAVVQNPLNTEVHNNLGIVIYQLGDMGAAAGSFREAVKLYPENMEAHKNLSFALRGLGQNEEAEEHQRIFERLKSQAR